MRVKEDRLDPSVCGQQEAGESGLLANMWTFPTTSAYVSDLQARTVDYHRLHEVIEAQAVPKDLKSSKAAAAPLTTTDLHAARPALFHIHTLTLESTLLPPEPTIPRRYDHEPNPHYASYLKLTELLSTRYQAAEHVSLQSRSAKNVNASDGTRFRNIQFNDYRKGRISNHLPFGMLGFFLPEHNVPFLAFPPFIPQGGKEWLPSSNVRESTDWLHAVVALDPATPTKGRKYHDGQERFVLVTSAKVCWIPSGPEDSETEIKLVLTVDVLMDMEKIYVPLPDAGHDMLGMIFNDLIPSPTAQVYSSDRKAKAEGLRSFFSSLQPAPMLRAEVAVKMQPEELVSTLLPFQRRTVAQLLAKEGAEGHAGPSNSDPDGFWAIVDFGVRGKVAYRRITGEFFPLSDQNRADGKGKAKAIDSEDHQPKTAQSIVDLSDVRGAMLCEEMGEHPAIENSCR